MSWTVSTWEKPDGFVSSSNEKGQHDNPAESASESDSEDSENEAESSETNFKVCFLQIYFCICDLILENYNWIFYILW